MINFKYIQLFTLILLTILSTSTFAGEGKGCSKNKAHQELSADALKNLDKDHFWSKFYDHHKSDQSTGHDNKTIIEIDTDSTSGLIES